MAKCKKVVSDGEYASICMISSPHLKVEDEVCHSKRENCGQGGHLGQLKKLERVQTKVRRPMKTNPAQNALDSQLVNIMAPEAKTGTEEVQNTNEAEIARQQESGLNV